MISSLSVPFNASFKLEDASSIAFFSASEILDPCSFIFLFLLRSKNQPKQYRILTVLFQQIIIIGFFIFLLKTSNPFNYIFPVPKEGLGLNPILQDPALAIHPPILYLGYVGSSIIFSASLASLIQNNIDREWAVHI